jgi:hypothetical protein
MQVNYCEHQTRSDEYIQGSWRIDIVHVGGKDLQKVVDNVNDSEACSAKKRIWQSTINWRARVA